MKKNRKQLMKIMTEMVTIVLSYNVQRIETRLIESDLELAYLSNKTLENLHNGNVFMMNYM